MKKLLSIVAVLFISTQAFSQFYISASGGYSIGSAGTLMGTSLNADQSTATNSYGSYGEGLNGQLRAGYFFNDTFGVELGLGYLHGADQVKDSYESTTYGYEVTDAKAYARAYGLTAALIYNFNESIYGKFGAVTKVGGKTVAEFTKTTPTPFGNIVSVGEQEYHGKLPLGFIGAMGYRYKVSDKVALFAELEYLGINVKRDYSKYTELTVTYPAIPANALYSGSPAISGGTYNVGDAPVNHPVFGTIYAPEEITYYDSLPADNSDPSKQLSEISPYSSFGLNIGITFTLGK